MDFKETLNLNYYRRFGVEIELNSFDGKSRPSGLDEGALPLGTYYVANLVQKSTKDNVLIHKWGNDHNNTVWVIKPDGSCGLEVCSPVLKGWLGIKNVCKAIESFQNDSKIRVDDRCSFHIHVEVSDLNKQQIASIISWWIKCEPVFLDSVPASRKINQYCQFLGQLDMFPSPELFLSEHLINKVGGCKYFTINTFHYQNKKRQTIEFRIMDKNCCLDPWMAKNWIRLILHFVETAIKTGLPSEYVENQPKTGYCWLDPLDVFDFLGLLDEENLSVGLQEVRSWFISRLVENTKNYDLLGVMSKEARFHSIKQIENLQKMYFKEKNLDEDLYNDNFKI